MIAHPRNSGWESLSQSPLYSDRGEDLLGSVCVSFFIGVDFFLRRNQKNIPHTSTIPTHPSIQKNIFPELLEGDQILFSSVSVNVTTT